MSEIEIKTVTEERTKVIFQENALGLLPAYLTGEPFVFSDENVIRLYGEKIEEVLPTASAYTMSAGEAHKTPETLFKLLEAMAGARLTKRSVLIAVGGGVVGDIGGLAAALYMRGIPSVYVPTTLLADVDASIGGKTAINFCGIKNLVGTVRQPRTVLIDPAFLATLPRREIVCGLGEIVKHAALSPALFDILCAHEDELFDLRFLAGLIPENLRLKADIVQSDPADVGPRRRLNLGHTAAHAIEMAKGDMTHGECVLCGIIYEAELAKKFCDCDTGYLARLEALCRRILPLPPREIDGAAAARLALFDKKNGEGGRIVSIVPTKRGACVALELSFSEYEGALAAIRRTL